MEIQTSVALAEIQLEVESTKGDAVSTKRYWSLTKSCGSQSSEWEERKKSRVGRGSLCEPCKPRKTVTCHGLGVVEPVYHQASLRGSWSTAVEAPEHSWAVGGAPCKPRKTVFLLPFLWQAIPVTMRPDCGCWATSRRGRRRRPLQVCLSCSCLSCFVCTISRCAFLC